MHACGGVCVLLRELNREKLRAQAQRMNYKFEKKNGKEKKKQMAM